EQPEEQRLPIIKLLTPRSGVPRDASDPLASHSDVERYRIAQSLMRDLNGTNTPEEDLGRLLGPRRIIPSEDTIVSTAKKLLSMLTSKDSDCAAGAATILSALDDANSRHNMLGVMYGDDMASKAVSPEGQRLLTMLRGTELERERAQILLSDTESPQQARHIVQLAAGDKQQRSRAEALTGMLSHEPLETRQILRLLMSEKETERQEGAAALDIVTGKPSRFDRTREGNQVIEILGMARDNVQSVALLRIRREQPQAYEQIRSLLNTSNNCDEVQIVRSAQEFLDSYGNRISRRIATWMNHRDHGGEADLEVGFGLMKVMVREGGGEAAAGRFLDALESPDAEVQTKMRAALARLRSGGQIEALDALRQNRGTREVGNQILNMLSSTSDGEARGATNLMVLLEEPDKRFERAIPAANPVLDEGRKILSRMQNPKTAEQTRNQLTMVQTPGQLAALSTLPENQARTEILRMLRSNPDEQRAARNFLDLLANSSDLDGSGFPTKTLLPVTKELLSMLDDPRSRPEALAILKMGSSERNHLSQLGMMLSPIRGKDGEARENPFARSGRWLLEGLANKEKAPSLLRLIDRTDPLALNEAVFLLSNRDPMLRKAGEHIQGMLTSEDESVPSAVNALNMLANPATRENGLRIVQSLVGDDRQQEELAQALLRVTPGLVGRNYKQLVSLALDPGSRRASQFLLELLSDASDRDSLKATAYLLSLLANPATRSDGERLRDLLNDRSQQDAAMRELHRRRPASARIDT
ncbi:MAG: hypothetical protein K2Z81_13200, partial [Cyanobacteria bacterium]|nr:hypothetical protein [Cyanobacteriota bacterium]